MKKLFIILALAGLILNVSACNNYNAQKANSNKKIKKKGKYFCTMNPDVTSDKPGVCSKCGMELVKRDTADDK